MITDPILGIENMNDLTFKVFDERVGKWLSGPEIHKSIAITSSLEGTFSLFPVSRSLKIVKSTGYLDNKKKEIWEGDIVRFHDFYKEMSMMYDEEMRIVYEMWGKEWPPKAKGRHLEITKVEWFCDGWYVRLTKENGMKYYCSLGKLAQMNLEVIGNMFENSKLIKK
jgi:uncharacterized phage protein (TIGR01671 family)